MENRNLEFSAVDNQAFLVELESSQRWPELTCSPTNTDSSLLHLSASRDTSFSNMSDYDPTGGVTDSEMVRRLELLDNAANTMVTFCSPSSEVEPSGGDVGCSTRLLDHDKKPSRGNSTLAISVTPSSQFALHPFFKRQQRDVAFNRWNWHAIRFVSVVLLCTIMATVFFATVALLIVGPSKCRPPHDWWQGATVYEVFVASYQDSDNDGYGDFKGLIQRLDYIKNMSVHVIRLNSIYSALDYPLEFEHIIDFHNVDPHLGKIQDFERLVDEIHSRDMYIVLDLDPTSTSDQHVWAAHWQMEPDGVYGQYYIGKNATSPYFHTTSSPYTNHDLIPPNRMFGGSVVLNFSHLAVQNEILNVMEFWLLKGVDGFYIQRLEHLHILNEDELLTIVQGWHAVLQQYSTPSHRRVLYASVPIIEHLQALGCVHISRILGYFDVLGLRIPLALNSTYPEVLEGMVEEASSRAVRYPIREWMWYLGSATTPRLSELLEAEKIKLMTAVMTFLPGSISWFYGDEIGLRVARDRITSKEYTKGELSPMQWTLEPEANFTSNGSTPWLPIHGDNSIASKSSPFETVQHVFHIRNESIPLYMTLSGLEHVPNYEFHSTADPALLVISRYYHNHPRLLLLANFGDTATYDLSRLFFSGRTLYSTSKKTATEPRFQELTIGGGQALIVELEN